MKLADVDRLNILFFGEMDISDVEKMLRIRMATELERLAREFLAAQQKILNSGKSDKVIEAAMVLAAATFSSAYRRFFNEWFGKYSEKLTKGNETGYPNVDAWRNEHAIDLSVWLNETASENPSADLEERVRAIIRTEVNAIANLVVIDSMFSRGAKTKTWHTFGDKKVRTTHKRAAGQTVPIDKPFVIGGFNMMFPQDSSLGAPPEEIVNCRCTMTSEQ